jgi:hypothetical protein
MFYNQKREDILVENYNLGRGWIKNSPDFTGLNSYIRWANPSFIKMTNGEKFDR